MDTIDENGEFVATSQSDPIYGDEGYTGDTGSSPLSLDYYRQKATEFQAVMNGLDNAYSALVELSNSAISDTLRDQIEARLSEYDQKKAQFRVAAEAINAAAGVINSLGGRFPQLSIPGTLGLPPLLIPAGIVAGVAAAATLAYWGKQWISSVIQLIRERTYLAAQSTPEERAALARAMQQAQAAEQQADSGPWAVLGSSVKWVVLAVGAYVAYRIWQNSRDE